MAKDEQCAKATQKEHIRHEWMCGNASVPKVTCYGISHKDTIYVQLGSTLLRRRNKRRGATQEETWKLSGMRVIFVTEFGRAMESHWMMFGV